MSFRARLIISLVILLIPLIASDAYFHYEQYVANRNNALAEQMRTAVQLAASVEVFVDRTIAVQRAVGEALVISHWHGAAARQGYVASVLSSVPTLRYIAFANPSGLVTEGAPARVIGTDISDRAYFHAIQSGANWVVSGVLESRFTGRTTFVIASALRSDTGELLGIVVSGVNETTLVDSLHVQPTPQTRLVLLDTNGRVSFAAGFPGKTLVGDDWSGFASVRTALTGQAAEIDQFDLPGEPILTGAIVPIPLIGWAAGAFIPRDVVIAPVRQAAIGDALITAIVLLITLIVGIIVAQQMVHPIERLSDTAERLGRGALETRAAVPNTMELATLATTMNRMAESIQQRDAALHEAYERELRIATVLQQRMLPEVPARVGDVELAVGYFPALEEAEIGGDFYDVMLLPNGLIGLLIADVSGKGLSAAVSTAMAKYMLEGFAYEEPEPARALCRLNAAMRQYLEDWRFITAFFGILDPGSGTLTYANAGHLQPILRHADGATDLLSMPSGPPLGVSDSPDYRLEKLRLVVGDSLLGYTDGVTEARSDGEWFGEERLVRTVGAAPGAPADLVEAVHRAVMGFTHGHPSDDIALLAVRMTEGG